MGWTLVLAFLLFWNIRSEIRQTTAQATYQTRTFFQDILLARFWNALHGGLYVPVTTETPPNPYLTDDPLRDLTTTEGLKLTKINPAYMTRQLAQLSAKKGYFLFHLTSLTPINKDNLPYPWEAGALREFAVGKEEFYEITEEKGEKIFRYIAPLIFEDSCMKCHVAHGGQTGAISGGISVSFPASPMLESQQRQINRLSIGFVSLWVCGLFGILGVFFRLKEEEGKRVAIIAQLREALAEVKTLSGLLPICCSCKKIRNDEGYWQEIEHYVREHTSAQFSHGLCWECAEKLYPDIMKKTRTRLVSP